MTNPDRVKYEVVEYTRGTVLQIGGKAFPHFLYVDTPGPKTRPEIRVEDPSDLSLVIEDASVDAIYCDGFARAKDGLKDWWRCIKPGGHLVLVLEDGPQGDPNTFIDAMRDVDSGWDLKVRHAIAEGYLLVFGKTEGLSHIYSWLTDPKPRKTACVVRYGGFGDMLQAANLFPELKRQGYHVTMMTTPKGKNIIEHDPHVDAWYIQDNDQVPNHELGPFWETVSKRYDKFINLCESVEGTLLAMPGRANHGWPWAMRHQRMNDNYLEFAAQLAEIPYASDSKFYPTSAEEEAAKARLLDDGFNVVFALAGSSCHKFYPGQDAVIARILLEKPNCRIFLMGDDACKILEAGWEKEPRVVCLSGEMGIRDTLALAKVADAVVGCETGVLNAVAFETNRKVCLLSHSSHENLTKHWINSVSLAPQGLSCYPCHRLHYTREFCLEDPETGAAMCQKMIPPGEVFEAIVAEEIPE